MPDNGKFPALGTDNQSYKFRKKRLVGAQAIRENFEDVDS